jgi:hypothetical protein
VWTGIGEVMPLGVERAKRSLEEQTGTF